MTTDELMALANLQVYCETHKGYRDECNCPVPTIGCLIESGEDNRTAKLICYAGSLGYPNAEAIALAERFRAGQFISDDDYDALLFKLPEDAEQWLDENRTPEGFTYGWCNLSFFFQTVRWWETETQNGRPDQA